MALDAAGDYAKTLSQEVIKQFIDVYRESPELWDPMNVNYTNPGKRRQAQERLLEVMKKIQPEATRHDVRAKINSIRSNYKKLKIKVEKAEAQGIEYIPSNWSYNYLRFLDSIKKPDRLRSSAESETACDSDNEVEHENDTVYVVMDDTREDLEVKFEPTPPRKKVERVGSSTPRKRIRFSGIVNEQTSSSGVEPIALVWSSKLQALRLEQRLLAEKAINDVLFAAALNKLGQGALVISTSGCVATDSVKEFLEYSSEEE